MRRCHWLLLVFLALFVVACGESVPQWEKDNPVVALPEIPLGAPGNWEDVPFEVTPEKVRLGRWLFYDGRLSADGTISCATCHRPENAFSEPTPVSTGIDGQKGGRKAPTFLNAAFNFYQDVFWDGRAATLQEQAKGPIENPIEMGTTHAAVVETLSGVAGYRKAFAEVFGDDKVDIDRIADAIAAYEATRLSGNSAWDRWKAGDENAISAEAKRGHELFHGDAKCVECHVGQNFTDARFHNLGVGWDEEKQEFKDIGRFEVTKKEEDKGSFKTPTIRDITKHAPYMHDGSQATLEEVVEHYNKGGNKNPQLDGKMVPLNLTPDDAKALVEFMKALDGEGYQDTAPKTFPQ